MSQDRPQGGAGVVGSPQPGAVVDVEAYGDAGLAGGLGGGKDGFGRRRTERRGDAGQVQDARAGRQRGQYVVR